MRLLALVPKPRGVSPGQRFRLEQWAPRLETEHGIKLDFEPFESPELTRIVYEPGHRLRKAYWLLHDLVRRRESLTKSRGYDGVIVYREAAMLGPALYERLLARRVPLFFDFDDAIWLAQSGGPNGAFSRLHFWGKTATICRLSTTVFVGNEYLAAYARRHNPRVAVIPTSIELRDYPIQPEPEGDDPFVIGWSGSLHTLPHFETARPTLEALARRRRIAVKVICNRPPTRPIAGAENVFVPWEASTEARELGTVHVGMMPLPDDPFTRGKCGLKALQFMAVGRPVVVSPVGVNGDIVRHGENGFLAGSVDEWVAVLERLAASRELRGEIGRAGRATIEKEYASDVVAAKLAEALRTALRSSAARAEAAKPDLERQEQPEPVTDVHASG